MLNSFLFSLATFYPMPSIYTKEKIFHETSIERKAKSREKSSISGTRRNYYKWYVSDFLSYDLSYSF